MQKTLLLLFFAFAFTISFAQNEPNCYVQQFTTENGLPSNVISGLQWDDETGFLWMATGIGIVRFNGIDFKVFNKENIPQMAMNRMLFALHDNTGSIHIADQLGNMYVIQKNEPVLWRTAAASGKPSSQFPYFAADADTFFQKKSNKTFAEGIDKLFCLSDTSSVVLNKNNLYYHSKSLPSPVILPFKQVNYIFEIDKNYFLIDTNEKIYKINFNDNTLSPVPIAGPNAGLLKPAGDNNLLFWQPGMTEPVYIEDDKVWVLKYENGVLKAELQFVGVPTDSYIKSVQYSKKKQLLFIGTESSGLIVASLNKVESLQRKNGNPKNRNSYFSQVELNNGNVLTNEGDIIGKTNFPPGDLPIAGKFLYNVTKTPDGSLWYSKQEPHQPVATLHQYNAASKQTIVYNKLSHSELVVTNSEQLYIVNHIGIGLLKADSMDYIYKFKTQAKPGLESYDFVESNEKGIFYIANCGGLLRYNMHLQKLDTLLSRPGFCIGNVWLYKEYVLCGSNGAGFYMCKGNKVKAMPLDKQNSLLFTNCFVPDDKGFCWISSNKGIYKCLLSDLVNYFENEVSEPVYYHYFGKKDGMKMTELNGGCTPCALYMKDKTVSFPSMDGLQWIKPDQIQEVLPTGDIYIDEIVADNKRIPADSVSKIKLDAYTGEIIIRPQFAAWCGSENIYLQYQVNDTTHWNWVTPESNGVIRLINLSQGKYTVRIRKMNGYGQHNFSYATVQFTINTPWYKRWWFVLLCVLAFLGVIALFFRFRTRQYKIRQYKLEKQVAEKTKELQTQNEILEKNNTIKTRLISIISHDIVTPLRFVTVAGKNLIEKRSLMSEELQQETIQEITNTSQELQLLSTNILNWIKYQNENRRLVKESFTLHDMINQVLGVLFSLAKQKNLVLENTVDPELKIYQYFEPLKILVYNLFTNAINFSEKGSIIISAQPVGDKLIITVKDEGVGMTADQIKNIMADQFIISSANIDNRKGNGLGYLIIKDLIKTMNAKLQISSEKGIGTSVSIELSITK
ncbi:ATP-binding protein [Ferruginibacter sp. SUN106]|uniref:sensor histidine kinase n=1 Tax=Ferruginibacter sp. SUN106 TaxID=2978348 RepID=UPI003D35BDA8